MSKQKSEWKLVRGTWISAEPVLPGVWPRKEGGHVVRARAKEQATGRQKDIWKVLPQADATAALTWLKNEQTRVRFGEDSPTQAKARFSEFAASLFEHKVKVGEIRSARGRQKWCDILEHLIAGTKGTKSKKFVEGFGDFFLDRLRASDVEKWKAGLAELIAAGDYAPTTINGWLAVLRVICKAAKHQYRLAHLATEGVKDFDTSEHETYTEEEPNSLLPEEVGPYLVRFRELQPAHFAMAYLGMITGLRPSTIRPLRRRGPEVDVLWNEDRIRVRRSHTLGDEVMRTTKQKKRYTIDLPREAMDVLKWHVETQLRTPEQQSSDLLFPAVTGGFRSPSVLNKPLAEVAEAMGLGKHISQRALRRTFNDLARAANIEGIVTRSISGHLTEKMQEHYSTVNGGEQRDALARVIRLLELNPANGPNGGPSGEVGGEDPVASGEDKKKAG